jgi:rSAM/selenodomain-associated transferase 2
MNVQISIIIPARNESQNLTRLIPFLWQYGNGIIKEIIVSDGLSTDETATVCQKHRAIFLPNEKMGRGYQLAQAAEKAECDILWFVHADTQPPMTFADDLLRALSDGHQVTCFRYRFESDRFILKINSFFTRFPMMWCRGGDQSLMMTRQAYDLCGGYDKNDIIMEDYNIIVRAKKAGLKLHIIPSEFVVSDRKYHHNGYLRVNIANFIVFNMWRLGFQPYRLKSVYHKLINHPMDAK